jgi:putative ABC transport system permease protein
MRHVILASLRYRKARLALSSLAIVLGVAFVAGTLMLGASMKQSFFASFAAGARSVSAIVAAPKSGSPPGQYGGPVVPADVAAQIRAVPGVAAAAGRLTGPAALLGGNGHPIGEGFGINVVSDLALRGFTLVSGHLPEGPDQVDVDQATVADEHFRFGQKLRIVSSAGVTRTFVLTGAIDLGVNRQFGNAAVMAFQTPVAFSVTGQTGYGLIVARAAPGVSQAALAARIRALPGFASRYEVQTGSQFASEEADSAVHVASQFTIGILIFAMIALVVACIVVYNTFGILIAQRSREVALLRCVGADRRQVFAGMLAESATVGLVASAVGVLAGIGLTWVLQRLLTGLSAGPLVVSPAAVAISAGTGLAVTVGASVLPSLAATRIAPVAALGRRDLAAPAAASAWTHSPRTPWPRTPWPRLAVAAVSGAAGILLAVAGTRQASGSSALVEIAAGGCVCFVAVLALGPIIAPPVISGTGWLLGAGFGRSRSVTVRLATANARRNPYRVAATTAALTIGITLMTLFTVVISSIRASTDAAIQGHYPFDYIVRAQGPQTVPPRVVRALEGSAKFAMVAPVYASRASVNGTQTTVGAYGHNALGVAVRPAMVSGRLTSVGPGTAAVDSSVDPRAGGTIIVSTPDAGRETLRVVAVYDSAEYKSPMPAVLISTADYLRGFRPAGADQVVIDVAPGVPPAVSRAVVSGLIGSDPLLVADTQADYKASLNSNIDHILDLVGVLLALAVLIALTGISNTLTLSVMERSRESALMRALGLTRGQLSRMLLTEALLMAVLAIGLGAGLGVTFGAAIMQAFSKSAGSIGVLSVPYSGIALYALAGACAALAAAVLPARRAARTSVVTAMAET